MKNLTNLKIVFGTSLGFIISLGAANGIELTKDPSEMRNSMVPILKAVVHFDIEKNPLKYYPAPKTKSDHKKAWDNL